MPRIMFQRALSIISGQAHTIWKVLTPNSGGSMPRPHWLEWIDACFLPNINMQFDMDDLETSMLHIYDEQRNRRRALEEIEENLHWYGSI
jgi:hypothetical protein